jgi:hypothetical protein
MSILKRFLVPAIVAAALIIIGCGSDDPAAPGGGGNNDSTPPGIAGITALDLNHLDVEFNEAVQSASAQQPDNYIIVETAKALGSSLGDTTWVASAVLDNDGKTVHLATTNSLGNNPYNLIISGVADLNGNVIQTAVESAFTGNDDPDLTPPSIVSHTPRSGETGVGIGQPVVVQFSEPMDYSSVMSAFSWQQGGTPVPFAVDDEDGNTFIFSALRPLDNSTTYTVNIDGAAQDWAGNSLATTTWMFTTTGIMDTTPPTLVSSTPANGATSVPLSTSLVLTFSEAVEPNSLDEVIVSPQIGNGLALWSNGGRTVTFDPFEDLMADATYNLLVPPGGIKDLAGNGNVGVIQVVWSTGGSLASGGFAGTITGPGSAGAAGPEGAIVIAADRDPFGDDDDFGVGGTGTANASGAYTVANLPDGMYWPAAFLNTNDDGEIDPSYGDAIGAFGVIFDPMSGEPTPIIIAEGESLMDIDFEIYDPMAFAGNFSYQGTQFLGCCYDFFVGVFDTTGFQIENPGDPVFGTDGGSWPGDGNWTLSELDHGLEAGTYYVGAYLDGNQNRQLDAGDPAGFIGGMTPTPFTVGNGSDQLGLSITLDDSELGFAIWSSWPGDQTVGDGKDKLRRLVRVFKETMNK